MHTNSIFALYSSTFFNDKTLEILTVTLCIGRPSFKLCYPHGMPTCKTATLSC